MVLNFKLTKLAVAAVMVVVVWGSVVVELACQEPRKAPLMYSASFIQEGSKVAVGVESYLRALRNVTFGRPASSAWETFTSSVMEDFVRARDGLVRDNLNLRQNVLGLLNRLVHASGSKVDVPVWDAAQHIARVTKDDPVLQGKLLGGPISGEKNGCVTFVQVPGLNPKWLGRPTGRCVRRPNLSALAKVLKGPGEVGRMLHSERGTMMRFLNALAPRLMTNTEEGPVTQDQYSVWPLEASDPLLYSYMAYLDHLAHRWCAINADKLSSNRSTRNGGQINFFRGERVSPQISDEYE